MRALEPSGCKICGIYFAGWWIRLADTLLVSSLVYRIFIELSEYDEWAKFRCTKPFGLFLIVHSADIILFRLYHNFERYWRCRQLLAGVLENEEQWLRAGARATIMRGFKNAAIVSFLGLTFLGTMWVGQDKGCSEHLISRVEAWIIVCWTLTSLYILVLLHTKSTGTFPEGNIEILPVDHNRVLHLGRGSDNNRWSVRIVLNEESEENTGLTEEEIKKIPKCKLLKYEQLNPDMEYSDSVSSSKLQTLCTVCHENIKINDWYKRLPNCGHFFHAKCIDRWLAIRASCPVCRELVRENEEKDQEQVEMPIP